MSIIKEFKAFAIKGNVIDMAVGIIVGAAFGNIVSSFVGDIIMPPIGVILGGVDFSNLAFVIQEAEGEIPEVVIAYGKFMQTIIDFLIIAFAIFIAVRAIYSVNSQTIELSEVLPSASNEELLLTEIRDLLRKSASTDEI